MKKNKEDSRRAKVFVLVLPDDCEPPHGLDLKSAHDADKVAWLTEEFRQNGFDYNQPALVGYPLGNGKIQLLSGTHRHLAAKQAGIKLPVTLWLRSDIERMWGTELWLKVIEDIPVKDLEEAALKDGVSIPPYERIDLNSCPIKVEP